MGRIIVILLTSLIVCSCSSVRVQKKSLSGTGLDVRSDSSIHMWSMNSALPFYILAQYQNGDTLIIRYEERLIINSKKTPPTPKIEPIPLNGIRYIKLEKKKVSQTFALKMFDGQVVVPQRVK